MGVYKENEVAIFYIFMESLFSRRAYYTKTTLNRAGENHFWDVFFYAAGVFGFEQTEYTVNEADGSVQVCLAFSLPTDPALVDLSNGDIVVTIQTVAGTAEGNYCTL